MKFPKPIALGSKRMVSSAMDIVIILGIHRSSECADTKMVLTCISWSSGSYVISSTIVWIYIKIRIIIQSELLDDITLFEGQYDIYFMIQ